MRTDKSAEKEEGFMFEETEGGLSVRPGKHMSVDRAVIPSEHDGRPVVEIADDAFACRFGMTEVYVPDTVERIGKGAFSDCWSLSRIRGAEGVRRIGQRAFCGCWSLEAVRLPEGLEDIGEGAFLGCSGLVDVTNLSAVSDEAVTGAFGRNVPLGLDVHAGEDGAGRFFTDAEGFRFYDGGALPVLVRYLGSESRLRLPESCLGRAYLVSGGAFDSPGCRLESLYVPAAVAGFGANALWCTSLRKVEAESLSSWLAIDFENDRANPLTQGVSLYVGGERLVDLVVPEGTERIGRHALAGARFRNVTIPGTVKSFGEGAFQGCGVVDELRLGSVESWCGASFPDPGSNPIRLGEEVFFDGEPLRDLRIPEGVEEIPAWAFHRCGLVESVTLPESLRHMGRGAFQGCDSLRRIVNLSPLYARAEDLDRIVWGYETPRAET